MKKFLIVMLLTLIFGSSSYAELIDGPANVRETPNGKIMFSINNDKNVQCKAYNEKWYQISLIVWLKSSSVIGGKSIKKNSILYDCEGNQIGKTLNLVTPGKGQKMLYNRTLRLYSCPLTGYTIKDNIQIITPQKAKQIAEEFYENSHDKVTVIAKPSGDVIVQGIKYYYFEIAFRKATPSDAFINSKTGDIHACDLTSVDDEGKVLDSINRSIEYDLRYSKSTLDDGGISFKSKSLGIGFTIPKSWIGKYRIEEDKDGITVYFLPKEKTVDENAGELFEIARRSIDIYESMLDSVGKRYIKARNVIYVIGGPTDVSFSDSHKEFKDFVKIQHEVSNVVETIHEIL